MHRRALPRRAQFPHALFIGPGPAPPTTWLSAPKLVAAFPDVKRILVPFLDPFLPPPPELEGGAGRPARGISHAIHAGAEASLTSVHIGQLQGAQEASGIDGTGAEAAGFKIGSAGFVWLALGVAGACADLPIFFPNGAAAAAAAEDLLCASTCSPIHDDSRSCTAMRSAFRSGWGHSEARSPTRSTSPSSHTRS